MERTVTFEQPVQQVTCKVADVEDDVGAISATITLTEQQVDDVLLLLQCQRRAWKKEKEGEPQEAARELERLIWFISPVRGEEERKNG